MSIASYQMVDEDYTNWKSLIPFLYDWFANHNLEWPSLSCRWGPKWCQSTLKNRQRLYVSERTDGSVPNTLVVANVQVVKPHIGAGKQKSQFNENDSSTYIKKVKTIIHPGEVNQIRELPRNNKILATHTDSPDVFIWNVSSQTNRQIVVGAKPSQPNLILTGHNDNDEFALAMSLEEPFVLSGGKDKSVVLWSIQDHLSSLAGSTSSSAGRRVNGPTVHARRIFRGHTDTVEDVQFNPQSFQEFCSVGDDSCLILWDARTRSSHGIKVNQAHNADIHCVDWNRHNANLILTGSADNTVRMFDRRRLTASRVANPIHTFKGHSASVLCVQWCPDKASVFGSAGEDGLLNIWDHEKIGDGEISVVTGNFHSPTLIFQHQGHRDKVVDFHWNEASPWTIVSVSEDGEMVGGGGTLQMWRVLDHIYHSPLEIVHQVPQAIRFAEL